MNINFERKILFILLVVFAIGISSCSHPNGPEDFIDVSPFESGSGTQYDPYIIKTSLQMLYFSRYVNKGTSYYGKWIKLGNDIDISKYSFEPIGKNYNYPFEGVFDGDNHQITGIKLSSTNQDTGFFGYVENATIKNLILSDGFVSNSYSDSYYYARVGSLAGYTKNSQIISCKSYNFHISTTAQKGDIGGLIGYASNTSIQSCSVVDVLILYNSQFESNINYGDIVGKKDSSSTITP